MASIAARLGIGTTETRQLWNLLLRTRKAAYEAWSHTRVAQM